MMANAAYHAAYCESVEHTESMSDYKFIIMGYVTYSLVLTALVVYGLGVGIYPDITVLK